MTLPKLDYSKTVTPAWVAQEAKRLIAERVGRKVTVVAWNNSGNWAHVKDDDDCDDPILSFYFTYGEIAWLSMDSVSSIIRRHVNDYFDRQDGWRTAFRNAETIDV